MQFMRRYQLTLVSDTDALIIEDLRVNFSIIKSIDSKPNPASIKIWNLSQSNINRIVSSNIKSVILSAGYKELVEIFKGDIIKSKVQRQNVDTVIDLTCADGFKDYTQGRVKITLPAGATDKDIVNSLKDAFPSVTFGDLLTIPNMRKLPRGKVLNGNAREILDDITKNNGADWSIQDGELVFLPKNTVLKNQIVALSQDSGLIGSPEKTDDGLEITCLLNSNLKVGGLVRVQSMFDFYNGFYKIIKISHDGDNLGGNWLSKITAVEGNFTTTGATLE